jgi:arylsulfatase A-like enzyme
LPDDGGPDSYSFLNALNGKFPTSTMRELLIYQGHFKGLLAIRQGSWVLIPAQGSDGTTLKGEHSMMSFAELGFVNSDYTPDGKLKPDAPPGQLYDLSSDISQATNLYRQHPERVAELTALLEKIRKSPRSRP